MKRLCFQSWAHDFLQAAVAAAAEAKADHGAESARSATPPASTWVGQRRNLDQDMEAALDSFTKETTETQGRKSIGQRVTPLLHQTRINLPALES